MSILMTTTMGTTYDVVDDATINAAILSLVKDQNEQEPKGGKVQIWADVVLKAPIYLASNVILDFQGHKVEMAKGAYRNSHPFVILQDCWGAQVINARVTWTGKQRAPLVLLYAGTSPNDGDGDVVDCILRDLSFDYVGPSETPTQVVGLMLWTRQGKLDRNHFQRIHMSGVMKAIVLKDGGSGDTSISDNLFKNIHVDSVPDALITFDAPANTTDPTTIPTIDRNLFDHITGKWGARTAACENVMGSGNHFDHVGLVKDNITAFRNIEGRNDPEDWTISTRSADTYVCAFDIDELTAPTNDAVVEAPLITATTATPVYRPPQYSQASYGGVSYMYPLGVDGWLQGWYHASK